MGIHPSEYALELFLGGSADGAVFRASAAFDALFGIDLELAVAFGDRFHGAVRSASAAADARVRNLVSHIIAPPIKIVFTSRHNYHIILPRKKQGRKQEFMQKIEVWRA